MLLESCFHSESSFCTLTYAPETLPPGGSLDPRHLVLWLKRLRKAIAPLRLRYFACGEYGSRTWRPHYHAILFGVSPTMAETYLPSTWGLGLTHVGEATRQSMQYCAHYVTKKNTKAYLEQLGNRHPEFARMSRRPGLGTQAVDAIARAVQRSNVSDVPGVLRHEGKDWPMGRLIQNKVRVALGLAEGLSDQAWSEWVDEMRDLQAAAFADPKRKGQLKPIVDFAAIHALENKAAIFKTEGRL